MRIQRPEVILDGLYNQKQAAELLGVDRHTVATYEAAGQEIIIADGACISFTPGYVPGRVTGFETAGHWPDYTFTATNGSHTFTIQAHFKNADTFTATAGGVFVDGTVHTAMPADRQEYRRISANSKQTEN